MIADDWQVCVKGRALRELCMEELYCQGKYKKIKIKPKEKYTTNTKNKSN